MTYGKEIKCFSKFLFVFAEKHFLLYTLNFRIFIFTLKEANFEPPFNKACCPDYTNETIFVSFHFIILIEDGMIKNRYEMII